MVHRVYGQIFNLIKFWQMVWCNLLHSRKFIVKILTNYWWRWFHRSSHTFTIEHFHFHSDEIIHNFLVFMPYYFLRHFVMKLLQFMVLHFPCLEWCVCINLSEISVLTPSTTVCALKIWLTWNCNHGNGKALWVLVDLIDWLDNNTCSMNATDHWNTWNNST